MIYITPQLYELFKNNKNIEKRYMLENNISEWQMGYCKSELTMRSLVEYLKSIESEIRSISELVEIIESFIEQNLDVPVSSDTLNVIANIIAFTIIGLYAHEGDPYRVVRFLCNYVGVDSSMVLYHPLGELVLSEYISIYLEERIEFCILNPYSFRSMKRLDNPESYFWFDMNRSSA